MVTLLPEPDSPTMPRTSPFSSVRLTPSTACITPLCDGNSTDRFSISSSAMVLCSVLQWGLTLELGVQRIAQTITQQVECQDGDQDRQPREGHHPPGAQHKFARIGQHGAPLGRRGLCAQAQKAQGGGIQNGGRNAQRG